PDIDDELHNLISSYQGKHRESLLPLLLETQTVLGWLPEEVQIRIAKTLNVPLADVHGVIEFYSMLYNHQTPKQIVRVCRDPICHIAGAEELQRQIRGELEQGDAETVVEETTCLGLCEHAPAALFGSSAQGNFSPDASSFFLPDAEGALPSKAYAGEAPLLLRRVGIADPTSLSDYQKSDGYAALHKVVHMRPEEVINLVTETGILGRGGAMFPVGRKWLFTREANGESGEKYIVVNGDESEPGAFKDRVLMEGDPFAIIEAATIAGYAIGAKKGWMFIRGEYPLAYERLSRAAATARDQGLLGKDILGVPGFDFDIEMRRGAGAYVCGEETALFEAIEGKRGFPRKKPPFPVTHGLFQRPTAVNNIETLAALVAAVQLGVEKWRALGTEQSPGTKLFCLSGHIRKPGVYEMPFGATIREVIARAGGVTDDAKIQAVLVGGAAGVFISPNKLDMRLTYEDSRDQGVPLGSGALMVFDETVDLRIILQLLSRFFQHESCGKCFPCQLGTQRQMEILNRGAASGGLSIDEIRALEDIGHAMTQTSLCGLGQTAATAVLSALDLWPELYR
ncbi:MAG: NAD(P)H-dependent oxidoreductase subunit E, partial [Candidatus Promineifilaceae bacterium]